MGFHTYPVDRADELDDPGRFLYGSREELLAALDGTERGIVVDLGCGTGLYSLAVAPFVETLVGVDLQPAMLELCRRKAPPANVRLVAGSADELPLADGTVSAVFSTMTFHEYATDEAHREVRRILDPHGRLVAIDWTKHGTGEDGPPLEERYGIDDAAGQLQSAGYHVIRTEARPETFLLTARPTVAESR